MGGRTRKTANEIFARCCSMRRWWNELFRAGGWPWTGMEPEQRSLRGRKLWADERKRQLRRWPQAPLILLFFSISSSTSSSTSSSPFLVPYLLFHFLLLSIHISSIFAYILTSIRIAPHNCARLSEFFSFLISLSAIRCCPSSFFVRFISSSLLLFLHHSIPFSSAFHFFSYYQARSKPSSIRASASPCYSPRCTYRGY